MVNSEGHRVLPLIIADIYMFQIGEMKEFRFLMKKAFFCKNLEGNRLFPNGQRTSQIQIVKKEMQENLPIWNRTPAFLMPMTHMRSQLTQKSFFGPLCPSNLMAKVAYLSQIAIDIGSKYTTRYRKARKNSVQQMVKYATPTIPICHH